MTTDAHAMMLNAHELKTTKESHQQQKKVGNIDLRWVSVSQKRPPTGGRTPYAL